MAAKLKPYTAMKDSGVPWLGEVPEHWGVVPGRACFKVTHSPNTGLVEKTVLSLSYGQIVVKPEDKLHGLVPASFETYQIVEPGDVICRPTDLQNDKTSLRFGLSGNRGIITSAYISLRTLDSLNNRFGYFLLHAYDLDKIFYGLGSGLRQNLDWQDFKNLPCLLPSIPEQVVIVRFLDHVDRRIRRYISTKQRLISLLVEQKQAIIHRAVTRGLDPGVPLKPSGVEWLGDVPVNWKLARLSQFFTLQRGFDITKDKQVSGCIPVVSSGGATSFHNCATAKAPGVLVGRKGTAGAVHYVETDYWAHDTTLWVNDFKGNNPKFIYYVLIMLDLKRFDTGSANPTINRNLLHPELLAFPMPTEQISIASFLDIALGLLDRVIDVTFREIDLLREYRARLISDVVTGKLDVRGVDLPASDDSEAPEEYSDIPDGEAVMEEDEMQELHAEGD